MDSARLTITLQAVIAVLLLILVVKINSLPTDIADAAPVSAPNISLDDTNARLDTVITYSKHVDKLLYAICTRTKAGTSVYPPPEECSGLTFTP